MKQVLLIIVLAVGGYFGYQYYIDSARESTTTVSSDSQDSSFQEYLPDIPAECENKGKNLGDAIYGNDIGRISFSQRNFAQRAFQSCLVDAGFTDNQISKTISAIKEDVKSLNPGSAQGF